MGSFSVAGRRDHYEVALQRCSAEAAGSSIQLPSHEAGQVMKGRNADEWSACRTHWSWLVCLCVLTVSVRFVSAVIKWLTPHCIHSICLKCSIRSIWFGNILFISSVLHTHDVTTYAFCVPMQMSACWHNLDFLLFYAPISPLPLTYQ